MREPNKIVKHHPNPRVIEEILEQYGAWVTGADLQVLTKAEATKDIEALIKDAEIRGEIRGLKQGRKALVDIQSSLTGLSAELKEADNE